MNENEINDAFNLMSNSIFDNILLDAENNFNLNDVWNEDDFSSTPVDDIPFLPALEDLCQVKSLLENETVDEKSSSNLPPEILHHDCMWSGTCTDKEHKVKKKYKISHIDELITEEINNSTDDEYLTVVEQLDCQLDDLEENVKGPLVEPCERITKVLAEWDEAFNSYGNNSSLLEQQILPATSSGYIPYDSAPQRPLPPVYPGIPQPLQFFAPIQSFVKMEQPPPPLMHHYHQQQLYYNHFSRPGCMGPPVKHEMQTQLNVNIMHANDVQTEINNNQVIKYEHEQKEEPPFSVVDVPMTHYYPQIKVDNTSSSPLLFYNNNLFTLEQLNSLNFLELPRVHPISTPPPTPPFLPPDYNAHNVVHQTQTLPKARRAGIIKKAKKPKLTKKSKKKLAMTFPFHDMNGHFFGYSGDEPLIKRSMHNCMERQRRIGLKNLFVELKESIPELDLYDRVPKVAILQQAASYCHTLRAEDDELMILKKKNAALVRKLHRLSRSPK